MTNKEAIEDIKNNILPVVGGKSLVMAIKALEEQSKGDCEEKLSDEEQTIKKIVEKIDYILNDINPYSTRDRDFSIAQTARELSEAYKNLAIIQLTRDVPTIGPRIEYGTDGQPSISGGHVVPDVLQGWKYQEAENEQ
jgi:hypothetical protein